MKQSVLKNDGSDTSDTLIQLSKKFKVINYPNAVVSTNSSLYEADDEFYELDIKTDLKAGETIAILDNPGGDVDGYDFVLEISAEVKLTKDVTISADGKSGEEVCTVCIPVGNGEFVTLTGEYFIINGSDLAKINSDLNKNYKIAFASPC